MIALIAMKLMERFALSPKLAKLAAWGLIGLLAALLVGGAIWWFNDTVDDAHDAGVKQGVTAERIEAQAEVIKNVETANETRTEVRDPRSRAAYDECVRSARNPANCQRFMPQ